MSLRVAARLHGAALAVITVAAIVTAISDPAWVRDQLALRPPPAGGFDDALTIAGQNLLLALALMLMPAALRSRVAAKAADTAVTFALAMNLLLAGAAIGAYGSRLGLRFAVYGPLELSAFLAAVAVYVTRRRSPQAAYRGVAFLIACMLVGAASLEAFLPPMVPALQ